jgi:hypothetical protein
VSLPRLQQAIGRLAPKLARAKGLFEKGSLILNRKLNRMRVGPPHSEA